MIKNLAKFFILLLILSFSVVRADNLNVIFKQANEAYRADKFEKAVTLYQNILSQGYENVEIYYNLGNCYFRLNRVGQSVLYYEKALKLNPHDPDIEYNLELANLKVVDRIELPPRFFLFDWWDSVKYYYSLTQLSSILIIFFALAILLLIIWLFLKRYRLRRTVLSFSIILVILTILAAYIFLIRIQEFKTQRQAVILTTSVTVLSAPDENSTDVFVLHEGAKVHLDDQRAVWVKISLPDGKAGWIKSEVLGII